MDYWQITKKILGCLSLWVIQLDLLYADFDILIGIPDKKYILSLGMYVVFTSCTWCDVHSRQILRKEKCLKWNVGV